MDMAKVIKRELIDGAWFYADEAEREFISLLCLMGQYPIESIDDFLSGGELAEGIRTELMAYRQCALDAFQAGNEALQDAWLVSLHYGCRFHGLCLGARPFVQQAFKQIEANRANAQKVRCTVKVCGDSLSLTEIIKYADRERDSMGGFLPAGELWPKLFSALDSRDLEPEVVGRGYRARLTYIKNDSGDRGQITWKSFQTILGQTRKKASS
jgi:hypothetical protein